MSATIALVVGGTPGALASLVPKAVRLLKTSHPRFELQVIERTDSVLADLLRNGQIEIAVVTTGIDAVPPDILEEHILRDPFALIVGHKRDHLRGRVRLRDLSELPWVLPEAQGAFRRQVDALFIATDTPTPKNVIRCDSLLTTKAIVADTDYVTILPRQVVEAEVAMGVLRALEITKADFVRTVGIRVLADRRLGAMAEAFLAALRVLHVEGPAGS